jgi:hypothetical protein
MALEELRRAGVFELYFGGEAIMITCRESSGAKKLPGYQPP